MSDGNGTKIAPPMVNITVDGKQISVPKGTNLIEAAIAAGVEVPYYCYHPHLSIAGNCRMCQVEVEGQPKLTIACNTAVQEGMKVRTQCSSEKVKEAQRATLEFLLINHPLDCTVCDQAGHCKLQDYYYEYNGQGSRFLEEKEKKIKAEVLGPEVIYDAERCIVCTRCVRFCEEVSKTAELGVFNRGDRSLIGIQPGTELDNPLSGSVVDLCPVGALTHRRWRFNTRIWYTEEKDSLCLGCSTGCNVKVALRDGEIVQVKARLNAEVNQEWLCDEGRYGFSRFIPPRRLHSAYCRKEDQTLEEVSLETALKEGARLLQSESSQENSQHTAVFFSPFLTLEEMWVGLEFCEKVLHLPRSSEKIVLQIHQRQLSATEQVLVSPDIAPNARGFILLSGAAPGVSADWRGELAGRYQAVLQQVREGKIKRLLLLGDFSLLDLDLDATLVTSILATPSIALSPRGLLSGEEQGETMPFSAHQLCHVILPSAMVYEKSGVVVNRDNRLQRLTPLFAAPAQGMPEWQLLDKLSRVCGVELLPKDIADERALYNFVSQRVSSLSGVSLRELSLGGVLPSSGQAVEAGV